MNAAGRSNDVIPEPFCVDVGGGGGGVGSPHEPRLPLSFHFNELQDVSHTARTKELLKSRALHAEHRANLLLTDILRDDKDPDQPAECEQFIK